LIGVVVNDTFISNFPTFSGANHLSVHRITNVNGYTTLDCPSFDIYHVFDMVVNMKWKDSMTFRKHIYRMGYDSPETLRFIKYPVGFRTFATFVFDFLKVSNNDYSNLNVDAWTLLCLFTTIYMSQTPVSARLQVGANTPCYISPSIREVVVPLGASPMLQNTVFRVGNTAFFPDITLSDAWAKNFQNATSPPNSPTGMWCFNWGGTWNVSIGVPQFGGLVNAVPLYTMIDIVNNLANFPNYDSWLTQTAEKCCSCMVLNYVTSSTTAIVNTKLTSPVMFTLYPLDLECNIRAPEQMCYMQGIYNPRWTGILSNYEKKINDTDDKARAAMSIIKKPSTSAFYLKSVNSKNVNEAMNISFLSEMLPPTMNVQVSKQAALKVAADLGSNMYKPAIDSVGKGLESAAMHLATGAPIVDVLATASKDVLNELSKIALKEGTKIVMKVFKPHNEL